MSPGRLTTIFVSHSSTSTSCSTMRLSWSMMACGAPQLRSKPLLQTSVGAHSVFLMAYFRHSSTNRQIPSTSVPLSSKISARIFSTTCSKIKSHKEYPRLIEHCALAKLRRLRSRLRRQQSGHLTCRLILLCLLSSTAVLGLHLVIIRRNILYLGSDADSVDKGQRKHEMVFAWSFDKKSHRWPRAWRPLAHSRPSWF